MSNRNRLVEYYRTRLQNKKAQIRLEAIQELLLLEAIEVLDDLQEIFKSDEDSEVKKAAQEAGRKLYRIKLKQDPDSDKA
ncbi:hypothetical protein MASR2M15_14020 [Anaerolineales bacterium]